MIKEYLQEYVLKARKLVVNTAILCSVINAATFSMSEDSVIVPNCTAQNNSLVGFVFINWEEKAVQLFGKMAACESLLTMEEVIAKELDPYDPHTKQRLLDYMLNLAVLGKKLAMVDLFLAHRANPNQNVQSATAFERALAVQSLSLIELLLRRGALPTAILTPWAADHKRSVSLEQEDQNSYVIAKIIYCYGGKLSNALTAKEVEMFDQAKANFQQNISYLRQRYSPLVIKGHPHQELCEIYNEWMDKFFSNFLPVVGAARLASDYYGRCNTRFLDEQQGESWDVQADEVGDIRRHIGSKSEI